MFFISNRKFIKRVLYFVQAKVTYMGIDYGSLWTVMP